MPLCCVTCFSFVPKIILQGWCGLFIQRHLVLCVWSGENEAECSRKRARELTRNIPGKTDTKSAALGECSGL